MNDETEIIFSCLFLISLVFVLVSQTVYAESTFFDNPISDAFIMYNSTTVGNSVSGGPSSGSGTTGEVIGGGCITNWTCSDWGSCNNGFQIRNCTKTKTYCYADLEKKPVENQSCEILLPKMDLYNTTKVNPESVLSNNTSSATVPESFYNGQKTRQNWGYYALLIAAIICAVFAYRFFYTEKKILYPRGIKRFIGKPIVTSESGRLLGIVVDMTFMPKTGEVLDIVIKKPTAYAKKLLIKKGKKNELCVPFQSVKGMGDYVVIKESDIIFETTMQKRPLDAKHRKKITNIKKG